MTDSKGGYRQVPGSQTEWLAQELGSRRRWFLRLLAVCVFSSLFISWALSHGDESPFWITSALVIFAVATTSEVVYAAHPLQLKFTKPSSWFFRLVANGFVALLFWLVLAYVFTTASSVLSLPNEISITWMSVIVRAETSLLPLFLSGTVVCLFTVELAFAGDGILYADDAPIDGSDSSGGSSQSTQQSDSSSDEAPVSCISVEDGDFPWLEFPNRGWAVPCPACDKIITNEVDAFAAHWSDSDTCPGPQTVQAATWRELGVDPQRVPNQEPSLRSGSTTQKTTASPEAVPSHETDILPSGGGFPFIGTNRERVKTQCPGCQQSIDNTLDSLVAHWHESGTCEGPPSTVPADVDLEQETWVQVCQYVDDGTLPDVQSDDGGESPSARVSNGPSQKQLVDRAELRIQEFQQGASETAIEEAEAAIDKLEASGGATRAVESLREQLSRVQTENAPEEADSTIQSLLESIESARIPVNTSIKEGEYDRASDRIEQGFDSLASAKQLNERHGLDRDGEIESAKKSLEELRAQVDTIRTTIDDVEDQIQRAKRLTGSSKLNAAEEAVEEAEARLESLEVYDDPSETVNRLDSELTDARKSIDSARADSTVSGLLGSVTAAQSRAEKSINRNEYDQATSSLETALESLERASELNSRYSLGRTDSIQSRREDIKQLLVGADSPERERTRERLVSELQALHDTLDRLPKTSDLQEHTPFAQHDYISMFGSWNDALEAAGIDKRRLLLEEFVRITDDLGRAPKVSEVSTHGRYSPTLYYDVFDGWSDLKEAAKQFEGDEKTTSQTGPDSNTQQRKSGSSPDDPSRDDLLVELRRLQEEFGDDISRSKATSSNFSASVYEAEFGSWKEALDESGRTHRERLLNELRRLQSELGKEPTKTNIVVRSQFGLLEFDEEFGDWEAALVAADETRSSETPDKSTGRDAAPDEHQQSLIEELARLWNELGKEPTKANVAVRADYSITEYKNAFGDWEKAIAAVERSGLQTDKRQAASGDSNTTSTHPTRQELIDELKRVNDTTEGPLKANHVRADGEYRVGLYSEVFGSFSEALDAAGIDRGEQLAAELRRLDTDLDQHPSQTSVNKHGRVSSTTITNHFGSWEEACERANIDPQAASSPPDKTTSAGNSPIEPTLDAQNIVTCAKIPNNDRLDGEYLGQVFKQSRAPSSSKDARVCLRDIEGKECWLDIWKKHEINETFETGVWYLFSGLRGHIFDRDGTEVRNLSSTRDMLVSVLGNDIDLDALRSDSSSHESATETADSNSSTARTQSSQSDSMADSSGEEDYTPSEKSTEPTTQDEDDILGDILGEFDGD